MRLQISFNVLDLQGGKGGRCGNQFIDLIDLELLKSQGRFCGDRVPGDYVSVGGSIYQLFIIILQYIDERCFNFFCFYRTIVKIIIVLYYSTRIR